MILKSNHYGKALLIFILSSSFYLYEFLLQVAPSVMMKDIMDSFNVGAVGFGTISAFYFYAYAPMQLPAGVLFDRYGPRLLISIALLLCGLGCFFFALTTHSAMASLGRFMIGFGSAFSFIGILILVARWFPPSQFALYVGIAQLLASVGAISGESPLAYLTASLGWRYCMILLASIGVILAVLVWCFVEDSPVPLEKPKRQNGVFIAECQKFFKVCRDWQTLWIGIYSFCSWTPMTVFAALWSVPYLEHVYGYSTIMAAHISILLWVGVGLGSPIIGWVSDRVHNRRWPLIICMIIGLVVSILMLVDTNYSTWAIAIIFFIIGIASSGQALSFAVVKEHNTPENVGTASGINNFAVVVGGALLQPVYGWILNLYWDGKHHGITPVYPMEAYTKATYMLPICYLIGIFIAFALIKETYRAKE